MVYLPFLSVRAVRVASPDNVTAVTNTPCTALVSCITRPRMISTCSATSGAHSVDRTIAENAADLDQAAAHIVRQDYELGSSDNLTIQIVRVDE